MKKKDEEIEFPKASPDAPKLWDTHTHLYYDAYEDGGVSEVERAIEAGVDKIVLVNAELPTIPAIRALASKFPGNVMMAMGLHPTELTDNPEEALGIIAQELIPNRQDYVAVGEIGIDLYCEDVSHLEKQMRGFDRQARLALDLDLPIIIHNRDGLDPTLEVLNGLPRKPAVVFHSFCTDANDVEKILRDFPDAYFGINGIVTFKNSHLRDVLPSIGIEKILLETDAPYLAPHPNRGKRNESAYIPLIAQHIAQSMNLSNDEVAAITSANAARFFRLQEN